MMFSKGGNTRGGESGNVLFDVHDRDSIVIEDCGNVFRGELVCRVADEKTCLSDRTVTDDHASIEEKQFS